MLRLLVSTCALALAASPALAQDRPEIVPTLSLSATAQIHIEPEFATVRSGVEVTADSAEEAVRQNAEIMSEVFSQLRRAGIEDRDMQTANLSVSAEYEWIENRSERRLIGYTARNIVSAKVRDLDEVGDVIDAMVGAGANNIQGVSFGAEDTAEEMDEARRMAVARLLEKADLFADAGGFELCGILAMNEGQRVAQPMYANAMARMESADGFAQTPVAAGELTLSATVSASFCIDQ